MSNDRGQGPPPRSPLGQHAPSPAAGRPLRGPQASANTQARVAPEPRGAAPARSDDLAHLYRKIADLQADAAAAEARAVKAEREQESADSMLGQMLARISEVEARLRAEQKHRAEGESAAAQAAKLRGSQSDMLERLQQVEAQSERLRLDVTHARRDAATHRLAADDQLHLLAKEREETAELRARLEREQKDRESLRARLVELDRSAGEHNEVSARAREAVAEVERLAAVARERELAVKLEQAWVEIHKAHDSADALEDQLADARRERDAEHAAAENGRRELAAERAHATEMEADVARLELARDAAERALVEARTQATELGAGVARLELSRDAGDRALTEARAELVKTRATHERAVEALREAHTVELAEALSERSRRERTAVDAEIAAGRRDLVQLEETLAEARRQIDIERTAAAEAQSLLAGEREWVAEMEEDSLRREEDLEKTRRAHSRAEAHARAAESRRVELEDAFAEAERALAAHRGDLEALRVEAAMHRMRIAELERERELRAGLIEVNAVPAEIERLRRRVASAEARAAQMHSELSGAIDEVTHLLTELERRELETARIRTQSLSSARSLLEHVTAATRPIARPAIEAATSARVPGNVEPPRAPGPANQAVDVVDEITAERAPQPAEAVAAPRSVVPPPLPLPSVVPPPLPLPSVAPPPLPTAALMAVPVAPPIVGLASIQDEDEDEATTVVERDSVRPLPLPS